MGGEVVSGSLVLASGGLSIPSRPATIDDVSSQEHIVSVLRKTLSSSNVCLFQVFPWLWSHLRGSFHTCYSMALPAQAKPLPSSPSRVSCSGASPLDLRWRSYLTSTRPDNFRSRVLELNASDERGISIVREKVKNFARQTPRAEAVSSDGKKYPCPPYKIIILDEADSMTQDAQAALRRIMENYARITRFCLVCNYVTRYAHHFYYTFSIQSRYLESSNRSHLDVQSFVSSRSILHQRDNASSILHSLNRFP